MASRDMTTESGLTLSPYTSVAARTQTVCHVSVFRRAAVNAARVLSRPFVLRRSRAIAPLLVTELAATVRLMATFGCAAVDAAIVLGRPTFRLGRTGLNLDAALLSSKAVRTEAIALVWSLGRATFDAGRVIERPVMVWPVRLHRDAVVPATPTADAQTVPGMLQLSRAAFDTRDVIARPAVKFASRKNLLSKCRILPEQPEPRSVTLSLFWRRRPSDSAVASIGQIRQATSHLSQMSNPILFALNPVIGRTELNDNHLRFQSAPEQAANPSGTPCLIPCLHLDMPVVSLAKIKRLADITNLLRLRVFERIDVVWASVCHRHAPIAATLILSQSEGTR